MRRQKLAPEHGRRSGAEEHPDDRPDRRRQDRDRPPPGAAGPVAVPQGRGVEVHRGRLRRPRRGVDGPRPGRDRGGHGARRSRSKACGPRPSRTPRSGCSTCCCRPRRRRWRRNRPPRRTRRRTTREKLREQLREGRLDDRTVEIEVRERSFPSFEIIAGSSVEEMDINVKDMLPGLFQGRTQAPQDEGLRGAGAPACRGGAEARRHGERGADRRRPGRGRRHHLRRRDRQDRRPGRRPRPRRQPGGRSARHPADCRGHDGQHEVRDGADRSHPVHRRRRVPRVQAVGPDPRAAGPVSDPGRARTARARRVRPHPHRAQERAGQAVPRRCSRPRGSRSSSGRRPSSGLPTSPRWSTIARRTSVPGGCTR